MDVRDIAPAIIAMAQALRAASTALYPDGPEPRIEIQAAEPGSFIVHLVLTSTPTIWNRAVQLFSSDTSDAIGSFIGVSAAVVAVIKFLAAHGGKPIRQVQPPAHPRSRGNSDLLRRDHDRAQPCSSSDTHVRAGS